MTAQQPEFNIEEFSKRIGVILDVEFSMIRQNKRIELHRRVCDIAEVIAGESRQATPAPVWTDEQVMQEITDAFDRGFASKVDSEIAARYPRYKEEMERRAARAATLAENRRVLDELESLCITRQSRYEDPEEPEDRKEFLRGMMERTKMARSLIQSLRSQEGGEPR